MQNTAYDLYQYNDKIGSIVFDNTRIRVEPRMYRILIDDIRGNRDDITLMNDLPKLLNGVVHVRIPGQKAFEYHLPGRHDQKTHGRDKGGPPDFREALKRESDPALWKEFVGLSMLTAEKRISKLGYEVGLLYDSKGKLLFVKSGDQNHIPFTDSESDAIESFTRSENVTFTHNHPSGGMGEYISPLSQGDLAFAVEHRIDTIRATSGPNRTYQMTGLNKVGRNTADMRKTTYMYARYVSTVLYGASAYKNLIGEREANDAARELMNQYVARHYKLSFTVSGSKMFSPYGVPKHVQSLFNAEAFKHAKGIHYSEAYGGEDKDDYDWKITDYPHDYEGPGFPWPFDDEDEADYHLPGQHDQSKHGRDRGVNPKEAKTLLHKLIAHDGFTYHVSSNGSPRTGYVLSVHPEAEAIVHGKLSVNTLRRYVQQHRDLLLQDGNYLGAWINRKTGDVFLDVATRVTSASEASKLAKEHHQLAYYDLSKGKEVRLHADEEGVVLVVDKPTDDWSDEDYQNLIDTLVGEHDYHSPGGHGHDQSKHGKDKGRKADVTGGRSTKVDTTGMDRSQRGRATSFPATKKIHDKGLWAQNHIAEILGGMVTNTENHKSGHTHPIDVILFKNKRPAHLLEVKGFVKAGRIARINMDPKHRKLKEKYADMVPNAKRWTVAVDLRFKTITYYIKEGYGAYRLGSMTQVTKRQLMEMLK